MGIIKSGDTGTIRAIMDRRVTGFRWYQETEHHAPRLQVEVTECYRDFADGVIVGVGEESMWEEVPCVIGEPKDYTDIVASGYEGYIAELKTQQP